MTNLIIGLFVGGILGVVIMAIFKAGDDDDEYLAYISKLENDVGYYKKEYLQLEAEQNRFGKECYQKGVKDFAELQKEKMQDLARWKMENGREFFLISDLFIDRLVKEKMGEDNAANS